MKLSATNFNTSQRTNFGQKLFEIANIDKLPCAYCGKEMISFETINDLFQRNNSCDTRMLDTARENAHLLNPFKQEILNYLTGLQYEYGLKSDGQIIAKSREIAQKEVNNDILERFWGIINAIEASNCRRLKDFLKRNKELCYEALSRKKTYEALITFIRDERYLGIKRSDTRGVEGIINKIISDIENPHEFTIDSYIIKKTKYGDAADFYIGLFDKAISSVEHLFPQSLGGQDKISNFLAVCRKCNNSRGSIPFFKYIIYHPEVIKNTTSQIKLLDKMLPKLISDNKIDASYEFYPQIISKSIKKISKGKIDIDV